MSNVYLQISFKNIIEIYFIRISKFILKCKQRTYYDRESIFYRLTSVKHQAVLSLFHMFSADDCILSVKGEKLKNSLNFIFDFSTHVLRRFTM